MKLHWQQELLCQSTPWIENGSSAQLSFTGVLAEERDLFVGVGSIKEYRALHSDAGFSVKVIYEQDTAFSSVFKVQIPLAKIFFL